MFSGSYMHVLPNQIESGHFCVEMHKNPELCPWLAKEKGAVQILSSDWLQVLATLTKTGPFQSDPTQERQARFYQRARGERTPEKHLRRPFHRPENYPAETDIDGHVIKMRAQVYVTWPSMFSFCGIVLWSTKSRAKTILAPRSQWHPCPREQNRSALLSRTGLKRSGFDNTANKTPAANQRTVFQQRAQLWPIAGRVSCTDFAIWIPKCAHFNPDNKTCL